MKNEDNNKMPFSDTTALLKFWAPWCGPCKVVAPHVREAADAVGVLVIDINVDEEPEVASQFGVRGIPTVVAVNKGSSVEQLVGVHSADKYIELARKALSSEAASTRAVELLSHTSPVLKTIGGLAIIATIIMALLQQFTAAVGVMVFGTIICVVIPTIFALYRGAKQIYRHHWGDRGVVELDTTPSIKGPSNTDAEAE